METTATSTTGTKLGISGIMKKAAAKVAEPVATKSQTSAATEEKAPVKSAVEQFVYIENLLKALEVAYRSGENIVLFGPGGHGKSEVTEFFFEDKGIVPFVKTMGTGTTTDSLFGGIDIKTFNETGKLEYLVENSFMNHEYVVFEELLDAPDYILEQLKDILTSKKFRNGTQVFDIKTKFIICCTNRERGDFATSESLKALMERFPLEYKVQWPAYTQVNYEHMFNQLLGKSYPLLATIMEKLHAAGTTVSPRTAIKAAKVFETCEGDYSCLEFIADFGGKNAKLVKEELKKFEARKEIDIIINDINVEINQVNKLPLSTIPQLKEANAHLKSIVVNINKLKAQKVNDELMKEVNGRVKNFEEFVVKKAKDIENATK